MRTKEQKRSEYALKKIGVFGTEVSKDDASFLVSMPTMILTNGIGQTLAFLLSKKPTKSSKIDSDKHMRAFRMIKDWLTDNKEGLGQLRGFKGNEKQFLESISRLDQKEYLKVQQETLSFLSWVKRYARAFQATEKGE